MMKKKMTRRMINMKLLYCPECGDLISLKTATRSCECGACRGRYLDNLKAIYTNGIPMGMSNTSLGFARIFYDSIGPEFKMEAFTIANDCCEYKKVSEEEYERS